MKAAYFTAIGQIEVRDEPAPTLSCPDEVLLRIDRVGVCGSDVHYFTDGRIGDDCVPLPASLGHECAGTIVEIGREVEGLSPGDRVAVDPAIACGACDQCRQGRTNTCRNMNFMGCPGQGPGRGTGVLCAAGQELHRGAGFHVFGSGSTGRTAVGRSVLGTHGRFATGREDRRPRQRANRPGRAACRQGRR